MLSASITVYTDNQGIISVGNTSRYAHPRFVSFLDLLNVYRLKWHYIPGKPNVLADHLSQYALDSQPEINLSKWDALATDIPIEQLQLDATRVSHNTSGTNFYGNTRSVLRHLPASSASTDLPLEISDLQDSHSADESSTSTSSDTEELPIQKPENISWSDLLLIKELLDKKSTAIPNRFC